MRSARISEYDPATEIGSRGRKLTQPVWIDTHDSDPFSDII